MGLFVLTYLAVYGGMTFYAGQRLWRGLGGPLRVWLPLWALALGMMLLPMLLHRLEGRLGLLAGRVLAGSGWTWLALVFWAFCAFLGLDLWNVIATAVSLLHPPVAGWRLSPRAAAVAVLVLLPLLSAWGWIEGGIVRLRTVVVESDRLPAGMAPLRLVQIADMHIGRTSRPAVWRRVLTLIRAAQPDVLVSTGDLVDAGDGFVGTWLGEMSAARPPLGKYAVLGNHEVYAGIPRSLDALAAAGFVVLRGETVSLGPDVRLAGVDDPAGARGQGTAGTAEAALLPVRRSGPFTVLLKHQPAASAAARNRCDLQLSGHTHGGQIFPFGWFVRLVHPYPHGRLVTFPEGLRLYVSRGTGTWGPPFRVFAPAEVTLFILRPAGTAAAAADQGS